MIKYLLLGAAAAAAAAAAAQIAVAGNVVRRKTHIISDAKIPPAFDGFRILLMSDLHDRRLSDSKISDIIAGARPDVILMAGDMHNRGCTRRDFLRLAEFACRQCPTYMVLGNHDPYPGHREYCSYMRALYRVGVRFPSAGGSVLRRETDSISLYGLGWNADADALDINPSDFSILLTHSPVVFDDRRDVADLTVAGHIHGGFIELPFVGAVFSPGENIPLHKRLNKTYFFPKYYKGEYRRGARRLIVSRGLGCSGVPFRFIPGETDLLILRHASGTGV